MYGNLRYDFVGTEDEGGICMNGMKKHRNRTGKIVKWFFLIWTLIFTDIFLLEAGKVIDGGPGIGGWLLLVLLCGFISFAGYCMEKSGKDVKKPTEKKTVLTDNRTQEREPAAEPVCKPVIHRRGVVEKGEFRYEFENRVDLFAEEKELAYPELPWNFRVAANIGEHILDIGGSFTGIRICGGCTEVSHIGAVAYGNHYGTLASFVENGMKDLKDAEEEAEKEYGAWFTALDYNSIDVSAKINDTDIRVEVSCFVSRITVRIPLGKGMAGFSYLIDLADRFGSIDYNRGVGAEKLSLDPSRKIFRRTYQLDETGTVFLSSDMKEEGTFIKYRLDVEGENDAHYEILPEQMERLWQLLKEEMSQKYLPEPAVVCAYYLQHHEVRDLIVLLEIDETDQ